ncbi:glycosyltransferase family 2 protein [Calidifontibacter sp. DB0510]|uniref:4,4'-diaponeurosporenoate glycosyltransferase n=1 Tax=Metallococcus carri TaxID=1656884 RepID=A0A967B5E5_9MICO|nr:glycosyltransferase family A protein [Metallococcus carri]NHN54956.1 glycosyltransferase family 2 protein [Metallococcus carri]NOP37302.1 glycosyltransferase family 2 protein [Calidifontibacter sp. DB2511S]
MTGIPLVTVVVPTRNNERTIEACLASVREQSYPRVELIVVDNHSSDATPQIAQRYADLLLTAGPERSAQRNAGIERAQGEWVLWLDSDMILPPTSVQVAMETAERTGADAVALPERTIGDGFWTACRALERECYLDQPLLHNPRLLRRELLTGAGAFHLGMSGPEDADLRLRLRAAGRRIELAPIVVDHDEGRLTVADVLRKRYYYGRSIPAFAAEHRGAVGTQGRDLLTAYAAHRGRLARDPAHAAGMVVLRSLEVVGYSLGARRGRKDRTGR